ncbi:MAG: hypothetical protein GY943_36545 [Chloroflexi bacterium]|nr:hypothetical protein [Chloroflexota bacterium]
MIKTKISEVAIRSRVGARSFTRGQRYYEQDAVFSAWVEGNTLKGKCWGSLPQPYRIWIRLGAQGIEAGECSCPVGNGGHCKHVAALLLTWLHQPDHFEAREPLEKALKQRKKDALIQLIQQMIARYPELEELVYLSSSSGTDAAVSVNPDLIRRQVEAAIRQGEHGHAYYGAAESIANELDAIMQQANGYRERGDWVNTAVIISTVLDELRIHHLQIDDHDGDLGAIFHHGSENLGDCLDQIQESQARLDVLRTLADIIFHDIKCGGYGLADYADDIVLAAATPEEKVVIASWVEDELANLKPGSYSSNWQEMAYGRFLLNLQSDTLTDDQFIEICRRTKQLKKLVERLLKLGRVNEAIADAKTASDYGLLSIADIFVTYEHGTIAEELVWERTAKSTDSRLDGWLKTHAAKSGDWESALRFAQNQFWQRPYAAHYQEIKEIGEKLGNWLEHKQTIISRLAKDEKYNLLTQIHLLDKDVDAALITLPKVRFAGDLAVGVAKAAEQTHPQDAVRLYKQIVAQLIIARGRDNYIKAVGYLVRVKKLHVRLDKIEAWNTTMQNIRNQKPRLPALLEELKRAGL